LKSKEAFVTDQELPVDERKTCPNCGGTWTPDRRACLACGASLEDVAAEPVTGPPSSETFDWSWLDAMAEDQPTEGESQKPGAQDQRPGCLGSLLLVLS
jgi:hypothetical protein